MRAWISAVTSWLPGVDEVGSAELLGELEPLFHHVDTDKRVCADETAELQGHQTDDAEAVDGDGFSDLDLGAADAVEGDVAKNAEGDFDVGEIIGELLDPVLLRDGDFAGLELRRHQPVGGVVAAAEHAVADCYFVDVASRGFDDADGCVAEPLGLECGLFGGAGVATGADAVHLGAGADLGEACAHEELIGCGGLGTSNSSISIWPVGVRTNRCPFVT